MIAAIADEHLKGARWAVLLPHVLLCPLLQAWQALRIMHWTLVLLLLCGHRSTLYNAWHLPK